MRKVGFLFEQLTRSCRLRCALLCLAVATVPASAFAQPRASGTIDASAAGPSTEDQRRAQEHFQRAKELYQAGSYRDAITELEVARGLDPKAKDLVMNLGIVHEKLGRFDEAVGYFQAYLEMEGVTPAERARAEGIIKRIEGAKREVPAQATTPTPAPTASTTTTPTKPPEAPARGRIDTLTVAAGSIALVGLAAGTGLGIYALGSRPDGFVTGRDGSYADLQQKTDDAHTAAIAADVSFAVAAAASLVTAWLYFGRTKDRAASKSTSVSAAPARSGSVVLVGGTF